jgi:hypothetical protein
MMVWVVLTAAAGHAAGQSAVRGVAVATGSEAGDPVTAFETWTCAHNAYRSVTCP